MRTISDTCMYMCTQSSLRGLNAGICTGMAPACGAVLNQPFEVLVRVVAGIHIKDRRLIQNKIKLYCRRLFLNKK